MYYVHLSFPLVAAVLFVKSSPNLCMQNLQEKYTNIVKVKF